MIFFTIIAAQYWELAYRTGETAFDSPWEPCLVACAPGHACRWFAAYPPGYSLNCSVHFTKWEKSANVDFVHGPARLYDTALLMVG